MSYPTHIHRLARSGLLAVALLAMILGAPALGEGEGSFVIITSRDKGPYERVVSGVRVVLGKGGREDSVQVHSLESEREGAMQALRKARRSRGTPIVTVGSLATRAALRLPGDAPVIACMIVDARDLGEADNATGVLIDFPLETQMEWIRRFLPKSQAIGVLYNPAENSDRIAEAKKIAERLGLRLVAREVHSPKDLPGALDSLAREADFLFALTDQVVLSRQTAQAILLFSFRNRMPFSGLSSSWVKAGALYALERDYEDLGAQCAEMVLAVRRGKRVSSITPVEPRKVVYTLNLRTAEHLRLSLPPDLVDGAVEVFR